VCAGGLAAYMTLDIITRLGKRYVNSKPTGLEKKKKKKKNYQAYIRELTA
jgi:hypothetical protein